MIHHLASFGWPYLLLAALVFLAAAPALVEWVRFEVRLARRVRRRRRVVDARGVRVYW